MNRFSASLQKKAGRSSRFSVCFEKEARSPSSFHFRTKGKFYSGAPLQTRTPPCFLFKTKGKFILEHPCKPGILLAFCSRSRWWLTLCVVADPLCVDSPFVWWLTPFVVAHSLCGGSPSVVDFLLVCKRKQGGEVDVPFVFTRKQGIPLPFFSKQKENIFGRWLTLWWLTLFVVVHPL